MRRPIYEKLDYFADLLEKTVQCNLDPVTELYYSSTGTEDRHAWIRDNLWAVQVLVSNQHFLAAVQYEMAILVVTLL